MDITENPAVIARPAVAALPAFDRKVPDRKILDQKVSAPKGFSTEDILWAAGIWSVLLTMAPVIFFYMLMVA